MEDQATLQYVKKGYTRQYYKVIKPNNYFCMFIVNNTNGVVGIFMGTKDTCVISKQSRLSETRDIRKIINVNNKQKRSKN